MTPNGLAEAVKDKSDVSVLLKCSQKLKKLFVYRETLRGVDEREFAKWVSAVECQCYCGGCMCLCVFYFWRCIMRS